MTVLERNIMDHLLLELQQSNQQFQAQLQAICPSLTAYELRLCTYLKTNLSTKEIATLLNITPDSVKKAKHRLRKKLNIKPEEIWSKVLHQQVTAL
ncbi:MAG: hypothetical protein HEP71_27605 [Roseivirga sp.]|nr:hypothetical protein [Roseivirga sp.]